MDLLIHFWDENTNYIITKHLGLLYFGRATAADLTSMLIDVMDSDEYGIPWKMLFYVSLYGRNIDKAVWKKSNKNWKIKDIKGWYP